jgi:hypothetical protein
MSEHERPIPRTWEEQQALERQRQSGEPDEPALVETRSFGELADQPGETWEEREQRLLDELDKEWPPAWVPENAGDAITGVVVGVNPAAPTRNGPCPVVTLRGPNGGERSIWLWHRVLRGKFVRANVHLGETVAIRFDGMQEPKGGGQEYANYSFAVDRPGGDSGAPDWTKIATTYGDELDDVQRMRESLADAEPAPLRAEDLPAHGPSDDDIPF